MRFEPSKEVKAGVEVGGAAIGEELLRKQVTHFAQSQILPIIEKFQSQGPQVVLEKIHEAGKSFWWDVVFHMSKEISPESLHLAKLGALFAVPLIARMSEQRVMRDVKIVNALRFIALFLIAVSPTYFEFASTIQQYAHQYPALESTVDIGTLISGVLIGGEYMLSLFEIISTAVIKRGEKKDAQDEQMRAVSDEQSDLKGREDKIYRGRKEKDDAREEKVAKERRIKQEGVQKKAKAKQLLLETFHSNHSAVEAVGVGRQMGMTDQEIYRELMKVTHPDRNVKVPEAITQRIIGLYDKRANTFKIT